MIQRTNSSLPAWCTPRGGLVGVSLILGLHFVLTTPNGADTENRACLDVDALDTLVAMRFPGSAAWCGHDVTPPLPCVQRLGNLGRPFVRSVTSAPSRQPQGKSSARDCANPR